MLTIFGETGNVEVSETPRFVLRAIRDSRIPIGLIGLNGSGKSILLNQMTFDADEIININTDEEFEITRLIHSLSLDKQVYFAMREDGNYHAAMKLKKFIPVVGKEEAEKAFCRPIALVHMIKTTLNTKIINQISVYPDGIGISPDEVLPYESLYRIHYNSPSNYGATCVDTSEVTEKPSERLCKLFPAFQRLENF